MTFVIQYDKDEYITTYSAEYIVFTSYSTEYELFTSYSAKLAQLRLSSDYYVNILATTTQTPISGDHYHRPHPPIAQSTNNPPLAMTTHQPLAMTTHPPLAVTTHPPLAMITHLPLATTHH